MAVVTADGTMNTCESSVFKSCGGTFVPAATLLLPIIDPPPKAERHHPVVVKIHTRNCLESSWMNDVMSWQPHFSELTKSSTIDSNSSGQSPIQSNVLPSSLHACAHTRSCTSHLASHSSPPCAQLHLRCVRHCVCHARAPQGALPCLSHLPAAEGCVGQQLRQ